MSAPATSRPQHAPTEAVDTASRSGSRGDAARRSRNGRGRLRSGSRHRQRARGGRNPRARCRCRLPLSRGRCGSRHRRVELEDFVLLERRIAPVAVDGLQRDRDLVTGQSAAAHGARHRQQGVVPLAGRDPLAYRRRRPVGLPAAQTLERVHVLVAARVGETMPERSPRTNA